MASAAAISPQHFQNDVGGGQSQYSDVESMSSRQQSDSISTAKCCHSDALSAKPLVQELTGLVIGGKYRFSRESPRMDTNQEAVGVKKIKTKNS